jgi:hypothetical protein
LRGALATKQSSFPLPNKAGLLRSTRNDEECRDASSRHAREGGHPVIVDTIVKIEKPRRTGSSAFADDDGGVDDGGSPVLARRAATKQSSFVATSEEWIASSLRSSQ